jgi:hypothetical protein
MSFIIIRLLQNFSAFELDTDAFPPEARPPSEWAALEGRKAVDRFRPKMHLTMYSQARPKILQFIFCLSNSSPQGGMWLKMEEATVD